MRNASSALIALLNNLSPTQPLYIADLMTIQWPQSYGNLQGSSTHPANWPVVARLTSAAQTLQSTSQALSPADATIYTFTGGLVTFTTGQAHGNIGLQVDDMPVTIVADPLRDTIVGQPWPQAARNGFLDGALVTLERLFMTTWGVTTAGTIIRFKGVAAEIKATRTSIEMTVQALVNRLDASMPRNCWQVTCNHMLYDTGCTLLKSAFTVSAACISGSTVSLVHTNLTQATGYFDQGTITFTSGANSGLTRGVYSYNGSFVVQLDLPLPTAPVSGDTFTIAPGCDKTPYTCYTRFSNLANFGGYPNIPTPETAL